MEPKSVDRIFWDALELTSPEDCAAFLDRQCGGDIDLRQKLEQLLEARALIETCVESPAPGLLGAAGDGMLASGPGAQIGPYALMERLGEGGMGVVFLAEQQKPVRRHVALKIIKVGMDTEGVVRRFEAERQAFAMMEHPNIARVFDAGATDTGRPYFVMELVKGKSLIAFCDLNRLTPKQRLELFIPVCQAVQHAHQKGIVHRDLKPSNILVSMQDDRAVPKVIDFGVAKAIDQRLTDRSLITEHGVVIGTLEYMSPEQAELGALDIDTRTDIYSLGVILYELLTGSTPLDRSTLRETAYPEILRRIREEEPAKPSTRLNEMKAVLATISAQRLTEPARLAKLVRGDLDWIVMKAIEKDRARRYETATALARDIERHLAGDAVEAGPPSGSYRLKKFARKHRAALATLAAIALLLATATAISAWLAFWANRERIRAISAELSARNEKDRATRAEISAKAEQQRALIRERMAIDAVGRYGEVVRETRALKDDPKLANLRATLLKEPLAFFDKLRKQLQAEGATTPDSLARLAAASFDLGKVAGEIGNKQDALNALAESLAIMQRLASEKPTVQEFQTGLANSHVAIGNLQNQIGRSVEALASYEQARAIEERLVGKNPEAIEFLSELAKVLVNIGVVQSQTGRRAAALESYDQARKIEERLVREHPAVVQFSSTLAQCCNNIGVLARSTGRTAEALASFERARSILERLAHENPSASEFQRDLAASYNNIGLMQRDAGQPEDAIASHERALAIRKRLAHDDPSVLDFQSGLARNYNFLGIAQRDLGRRADALASQTEARTLFDRLARANPSVTGFQNDLAGTLVHIGVLQKESGQAAEALASYDLARGVFEQLATANLSVTQYQSQVARVHTNIGVLHRAAGRNDLALASYGRAREIDEQLVRKHPESPEFASTLGGTLNNIAGIEIDQGRFDDARSKLTEAIGKQRQALAASPKHPAYRQFLVNHLRNMIRAAEGSGRTDLADQARRELAELTAGDSAKARGVK